MARSKTRRSGMGPPRPQPQPQVSQQAGVDQAQQQSVEAEQQRVTHQAIDVEFSSTDDDEVSASVNQDATEKDNVEVLTASTKKTGRKRKRRCEEWIHYDTIEEEGKDLVAVCKHCSARYMADPNKHGTKNIKRHVKVCKVLNASKGPMDNYTISYDAGGGGGSSTNEMKLQKFSPNFIRDCLLEWIICEELPFRIVESERFQKFCKSMEPRFAVPSRVTIARHVFKRYIVEKEKLKGLLKGDIGRVSLTTDMWTSSNNTSYMCITTHFIDKNWVLHKRIISFRMVEDHRGEGIGKELETVTKEWGIEKIMCITVDNAAANEGAVDWMKKYGSKHLLGGNHLHVRCFAHILNIIVKFGLQKCDVSVERIRTAVKYVRSSPKRKSKFLECAKDVGISCSKSLCLDVATRWNSTYLMLQVAQEFELAFDRLYFEDMGFRNFFLSGKAIGSPTYNDWDNARKLVPFLKPFYDATNILSGSLYVTINHYFYQFLSIRGHLIQGLTSNDKVISDVAVEMLAKYDQYFGSTSKVNMLVYVALVLDPRSKLEVVKRGLDRAFDQSTASILLAGIQQMLNDLYEHYRSSGVGVAPTQPHVSQTSGGSTSASSLSSATTGLWDVVCDETEFATLSRSELDKYLADDRETPTMDFDLLNFWKVMRGRYPLLAAMARDLFCIPASTVASESAFSTSGRVITDQRNSLLPRTVEALLCTQSWLKNVITIDAEEVILDDEGAQEVEQAAEEELDGGLGESLTSTSRISENPI